MNTQVFINLPVKNLEKSKAFFSHLGYSFNPQFTDHNAACMIVSDTIYVMLLTEPFFKGFINNKSIADAHTTKEALICFSTESREAVDQLVNKALEAGGNCPTPTQDHGFMYYRSFEDLDGHHWEIMYMDPNHIQSEQ